MLLILNYQFLFNPWPIIKMLLVSFIDIVLIDVLQSFLNWVPLPHAHVAALL